MSVHHLSKEELMAKAKAKRNEMLQKTLARIQKRSLVKDENLIKVDELLMKMNIEEHEEKPLMDDDDLHYNLSDFVLNYNDVGCPIIEDNCDRINIYELKKVIGRGAYGTVNILCFNNNCNYVLKIQQNNEFFRDEVHALFELQHTNCVPKIFDAWTCGDTGYLVIELLSTEINLNFESFATQLYKCVNTLHNNGWSHNDLKKDNLLFNIRTGKLIISDLGNAVKKTDDPTKIYDKLNTHSENVTWDMSVKQDIRKMKELLLPTYLREEAKATEAVATFTPVPRHTLTRPGASHQMVKTHGRPADGMKKHYGGGYYQGLYNTLMGGLPEIISYDDCKPPTYNQEGSGYAYITNPKSKRRVSIRGVIGRQILKKYIKYVDKL